MSEETKQTIPWRQRSDEWLRDRIASTSVLLDWYTKLPSSEAHPFINHYTSRLNGLRAEAQRRGWYDVV